MKMPKTNLPKRMVIRSSECARICFSAFANLFAVLRICYSVLQIRFSVAKINYKRAFRGQSKGIELGFKTLESRLGHSLQLLCLLKERRLEGATIGELRQRLLLWFCNFFSSLVIPIHGQIA